MSVTIDLTDDRTTAASVAALSDAERVRLAEALRAADSAANQEVILGAVRGKLAELTPAVGVLFTAMEWDNGYFLDDTGVVLFADNTTADIEFGIGDVLTDEYGSVGAGFTLAVDLRSGELDADTYGESDIRTRFAPVAKTS